MVLSSGYPRAHGRPDAAGCFPTLPVRPTREGVEIMQQDESLCYDCGMPLDLCVCRDRHEDDSMMPPPGLEPFNLPDEELGI